MRDNFIIKLDSILTIEKDKKIKQLQEILLENQYCYFLCIHFDQDEELTTTVKNLFEGLENEEIESVIIHLVNEKNKINRPNIFHNCVKANNIKLYNYLSEKITAKNKNILTRRFKNKSFDINILSMACGLNNIEMIKAIIASQSPESLSELVNPFESIFLSQRDHILFAYEEYKQLMLKAEREIPDASLVFIKLIPANPLLAALKNQNFEIIKTLVELGAVSFVNNDRNIILEAVTNDFSDKTLEYKILGYLIEKFPEDLSNIFADKSFIIQKMAIFKEISAEKLDFVLSKMPESTKSSIIDMQSLNLEINLNSIQITAFHGDFDKFKVFLKHGASTKRLIENNVICIDADAPTPIDQAERSNKLTKTILSEANHSQKADFFDEINNTKEQIIRVFFEKLCEASLYLIYSSPQCGKAAKTIIKSLCKEIDKYESYRDQISPLACFEGNENKINLALYQIISKDKTQGALSSQQFEITSQIIDKISSPPRPEIRTKQEGNYAGLKKGFLQSKRF